MKTSLSPSASSSQEGLQVLCSNFATPGSGNGSVTFNIQPDNDPVKYGLDLLFPTTPSSELQGFPVCEGGGEDREKRIRLYPTSFDGPICIGVKDIDWTARSFLTYIEDTVISKNVTYLCGFEWGFQMSSGTTKIKTVKKLTPTEWNGHVEYLSQKFPSWTFMSVSEQ
ncbi:hypothetical protein VP1G_10777 [Cytospora mali]|uniref:Uncharacterized protein n=1 Tax=Cytospora mali TaxID=578113 RepID=A0A194UW11_CYTMA|nr:hypothetical protein VP1G_10777 [Valsa mali var. pyri (nom. inval.)]